MRYFFCFIFLVFSSSVLQAQSLDAKVCFKDMEEAYKDRDMNAVIMHSLQYMRLAPKSTQGYTYYAYANLKKRLYWNAIDAYTKILGLASHANSTQLNRASVYRDVGYDSLCIAEIEKVIKNYPRYARGYELRAGYYMRMGEIDKFFGDTRKSISLGGNKFYGYLNTAQVYFGKMQFDSAYVYFDKAHEENPDYAGVYARKAWINKYYKRKSLDEIKSDCLKAIALYEEAIKINPSDLSLYSSLANVYLILENKEKAKSIVEKLIEPLTEEISLYPKSYFTYYSRAIAYKMLDRDLESMADFKTAMKMNPKCPFMQWTLDLDEYEKTRKLK